MRGPLDGVDLSAKMAEYAAELCATDDGKVERRGRGDAQGDGLGAVYRRVETGNLLQLDNCVLDAQYGLVVSADVLCYFGDLRDVLRAWPQRRRRGRHIFTVETLNAASGVLNLRFVWGLNDGVESPRHRQYRVDGVGRCHRSRARAGGSPITSRDVATSIGLEPREAIPFRPRMENGLPVHGTLHVVLQAQVVGVSFNRRQQQTIRSSAAARRPSITRRTELVSGRGAGVYEAARASRGAAIIYDVTGRRAELGRHATYLGPDALLEARRLRTRRCPAGRRSLLCSQDSYMVRIPRHSPTQPKRRAVATTRRGVGGLVFVLLESDTLLMG